MLVMAYLKCWLQKSILSYYSISWSEQFYLRLRKNSTFQSTGPNRGLQGMLWATACCALSWVLIITVLFVLAITFGRRFAFLRLKITKTAVFEWYECELWALHCVSGWEPVLTLKISLFTQLGGSAMNSKLLQI